MTILTIGRSTDNDVIINDPYVGRHHCQIVSDNGRFRIAEINAQNGVYVNGIKISGEYVLSPTDIVKIGNTVLPWKTYFGGAGRSGAGATIAQPGGGYSGGNNIINIGSNNVNGGNGNPPQTRPDSFLVWAILATIFCCLPFGIVSIVYASKVDSRWYAGDYTGAMEAAKNARTWFWWSFAIGLFFTLLYVIYCAIVGAFIFGY